MVERAKRAARAQAKEPVAPERPTKLDPGPKTAAAIEKAIDRYQERPARAYIKWESSAEGEPAPGSPHADETGHILQLMEAFGTRSTAFMRRNLGYLEAATRDRSEKRGESDGGLNAGLALMGAIDPQNEIEAALAVQMAGSHSLTMEMLRRAKSADRTDHLELYGNLAIKLQRTFTAQIEALARMRGKGQQTVRVEHVTVQSGAQAIVGDVHHHAPGGSGTNSKTEELPHGKIAASGPAGGAALPSPDPQGHGLPITGHAERPVQAARRTVARRARKSERAQARKVEP